MAKKKPLVECAATATVQLTIQIAATGCWGSDCTLDQIHMQAERSAIQHLTNAASKDRRISLISVDEIKAISIGKKR